MNIVRRSSSLLLTMLLLGTTQTGCSDKSRMRLAIQSIVGAEQHNLDANYLEVDMMGNFASSHCSSIQDSVRVAVRLESPGTLTPGDITTNSVAIGNVGPTLGAFVTGFRLEYFYYDPNDGALHGPVPGLTVNTTNLHQRVVANLGDAAFNIPLVSYNLKAWCARATCASIPGFPGPGYVSRVIARVTILGEDETGKKLSAQGDMLVYLYDYGPYPVAPVGGVLAPDDSCFGNTLQGYWTGTCN